MLSEPQTPRQERRAGLHYSQQIPCPACGAPRVLEGDDSSDMEYECEYGEEDEVGHVWATVHVPSDFFSCQTCHLVIEGALTGNPMAAVGKPKVARTALVHRRRHEPATDCSEGR